MKQQNKIAAKHKTLKLLTRDPYHLGEIIKILDREYVVSKIRFTVWGVEELKQVILKRVSV
jgi:hypothetical protein